MNVESLLRETLHERAAATEIATTPQARVVATARRRRRRTAAVTVAGAAVAVAAVTVPVAVVSGGGERPGAPVASSDATTAMSSGLRVSYAVGDVLHTPDGEVPLPYDAVAAVTAYDGGWLVVDAPVGPDDFPLRVTRIDQDGTELEPFCSSSAPVASPAGDVAWTETPCDGSGPTTALYPGPRASLRSVTVPDRSILLGLGEDGTLTYVDSRGTVHRLNEDGERDSFEAPGQVMAFDPTTGRIATGTRPDLLSGTMLDPDGTTRWARPDLSLLGFSPDGRHVLATGDNPTTYVLVADTGAVLTAVGRPASLTWEDDTHLVGVTSPEDGGRRFVRYDLADHTTDLGPAPDGGVVWAD